MESTIIGMAQTFVGSNNVNFLEPTGQFGSRYEVYNVIFAFLV
jgi:DNA topoisomerase-2